MLNEYFSVLHEHEVKQASNRGLVDTLKRLPNDELRKLASGELKLAYGDGDVDDWLQKYKGTPLFEKAVSLEQQKLELEANEQAQRQQRKELMDQMAPEGMSDERDRLCLEKRVLDLELATSQEAQAAGAAGPEQVLEQQEGQGLEQAMAAHETEQAQKAAPPAAAAPPQGGKGMTVSVKQDADKPAPPDEKQAAAHKIAAVQELAREMARQDSKLAGDGSRLQNGALGAAYGGITGAGAAALLGKSPKAMLAGGLLGGGIGAGIGASRKIHEEPVKQAGIADLGAKALGAVKPFAQTLGAGAKEVGGAFGAGGMKAGLGAIKDVGAITAKAHPLGTAALAGGTGLAAGKMLGGGQQR